jgi:hypothetical protein
MELDPNPDTLINKTNVLPNENHHYQIIISKNNRNKQINRNYNRPNQEQTSTQSYHPTKCPKTLSKPSASSSTSSKTSNPSKSPPNPSLMLTSSCSSSPISTADSLIPAKCTNPHMIPIKLNYFCFSPTPFLSKPHPLKPTLKNLT